MKLEELFPGSFNADHFLEGPKRLTIKGIGPILFKESDEGEAQQKGKMTFAETTNYWVFGKEAAGELAEEIQSAETDDWVGHVVELRRDRTKFQGKMVACVRASFADVKTAANVREISSPKQEPEDEMAALQARLEALKSKNAARVPA